MHKTIDASRAGRMAAGVALVAALALPASAQPAETETETEGDAFIDALYGERIDAVQATRAVQDDLALMAEMLDIAATLPSEPDAQTAVLLRVVAMSRRARAGQPLALRALDLLAAHDPGHPAAGVEARLAIYEAWYRSAERDERGVVGQAYFDELVQAADAALDLGDHASAKRWYSEAGSVQRVARLETGLDLRAKLAEVRGVEAIDREIRQLQGAARRAALTPTQARRLVVLLAIEIDALGAAAGYAGFVDDVAFAEGLDAANELGAMSDEETDRPPARWRAAGHWYAGLIDEPGLSERGVRRAMARARTALAGFIERSAQDDVEKARAVILLRQVDERHDQRFGVQPDTRNLMAALDPERHMILGRPFSMRDGKLYLDEKAILHLPVAGGDHYALTLELELGAQRKSGLIVWLPIAGRTARLLVDIVDHRGTKIDGLNYIDDPDGRVRLEPGVPAEVRVEVRDLGEGGAAIRLFYNDRRVWQWRGEASKFTDPSYGKPPDLSHFAVRVDTDAIFHRIEMQPLGEADE